MDSYAQAREKDRTNAEIMGQKRQEKALREFKQVLEDLVFMLRNASGMETIYLYWVNRSREQFVLESKSTELPNIRFQDRMGFEDHYLERFKDIREPVEVQVGEEIRKEDLTHYYNEVPIRFITLLPFINNGETVAITVLESSGSSLREHKTEVISSYIDALRNVLNTYLEISDLYEKQQEWIDYEERLERLDGSGHRAENIYQMVNEMQSFLRDGSVTFIGKGMRDWANVLNSKEARRPLPIGMALEERSIAYEALQKGGPEFSIHFNNNPKRISPREPHTEGATLAIPMLFDGRRQGVAVAYDDNPLIFKESTKHKLVNLVRMTSLQIRAHDPNLDADAPFLANEYHAFLPDLWERIVDTELERIKKGEDRFHTWMGLVSLANLSELRTRLRLEDLQVMQKDLVARFNPSRFGVPGIIGSHSDYVYSFVIQNRDEEAVKRWTGNLRDELKTPMELTNGVQIDTSLKVGFVRLDSSQEDSYQVLNNAKSALSEAMKESGQTD